jgi:hypothetical protein
MILIASPETSCLEANWPERTAAGECAGGRELLSASRLSGQAWLSLTGCLEFSCGAPRRACRHVLRTAYRECIQPAVSGIT